jgi:nitrous oxidase accessory protein
MIDNWIKKYLVFAVIILFIFMSITPSLAVDNVKKSSTLVSDGNTLYVGGSGEGNYTKIQDAIDNASDGDTVFVYDDSSPYYENIVIDKSINLIGENRNTTIIDGNGKDSVVYFGGGGAKITGFAIQNGGDGVNDAGISISDSFIVVTDNIIKDNKNFGINIWDQQNTISNNVIKNNKRYGINIDSYYARDITVVNNTFEQHDSIYIGTLCSVYCDTHEIKNNTANGKPIRCYKNTKDVVVPSDTSQVILINCHNCTIQNIDLSGLDISVLIIGESSYNHICDNSVTDNTWAGITIGGSRANNNTILNNIIADNYFGVLIIDAEYNTVYGNTINDNEFGVCTMPTFIPIKNDYQPLCMNYNYNNIYNNNICNNNITNNKCGVLLGYSYYNNVFQNNVTKNSCGISIEGLHEEGGGYNDVYQNNIINNDQGISISGFDGGTCSNDIYENNIMYNWEGVIISCSDENKVHHNNFINNIKNARDRGSANIWDDSAKGNYWDDYKGKDKDGNGIGDTPYWISYLRGIKDNYPLMKPYGNVTNVFQYSQQISQSQRNQQSSSLPSSQSNQLLQNLILRHQMTNR